MLVVQHTCVWLAALAMGRPATGERAGKLDEADRSGSAKTNQYALSEVVIQPDVDLYHMSRPHKRQTPAVTPQPLKNNVPSNRTIAAGDSHFWVLPSSELASSVPSQTPFVPDFNDDLVTQKQSKAHQELKRQTEKFVYVTLDICAQPAAIGGVVTNAPPGLTLWISRGQDNQNPGPAYTGREQAAPVNTDHGHADYGDPEQGNTYVGVSAPPLDGFTGGWTYSIAISTAAPYTVANTSASPFIRFVDSDPTSSLLVTDRLDRGMNMSDETRDQWNKTGGPFSLFVYNASDPLANAVNRSYCGLMNYATGIVNVPGKSTKGSEGGMKFSTNGSSPYEQFYVPELQPNTTYRATLGLLSRYSRDFGSDTLNGGGTLWPSVDLKTRITDNCKLIYNLSFCNDVAYSVPTNGKMNLTTLATFYDNYTNTALYSNFQNSLDQIPCDTRDDAKYSLARNCTDCARAYKNWVCAVSIPRCGDFLSTAPQLRLRNTNPWGDGPETWPNNTLVNIPDDLVNDNLTQLARNGGPSALGTFMNSTGPYREVLPCAGLCYDLVQSCPYLLGFVCPKHEQLAWGYGNTDGDPADSTDFYPLCNHPGRLWGSDAARNARVSKHLMVAALVAFAFTWI